MPVNKETLIAKFLSGNTSPEDEIKLTKWLNEDPSNQAEFDRIEKFWKASLNLKKESEADVENAWNEFKFLTEAQPKITLRRINFIWLKVAASVTLFLATAAVIKVYFTEPTKTAPVTLAAKTLETQPAPEISSAVTPDMSPVVLDSIISNEPVKTISPKRSKRNILPSHANVAMITITAGDSVQLFQLPDNSIVYLNANSKLEYPKNFNKTNRYVSLIGEAYFDVKKDSGQFIVNCENTVIKGRATMFNVKSHAIDKEVEVIVASGTVEFSGVGYKDVKSLVLTSGESGYYNKTKSSIVKSKHQRKNYRWWEKKSLRAKIKDFFDRLFGKKH